MRCRCLKQIVTFAVLLTVLARHQAWAQPEKDLVERVLDAQGASELSLEKLLDLPVVTASGNVEERSLAAANVFIITREEIARRGYRSLGEILRRVPGMYLVYDYVSYSVGVREVSSGYRGGTRTVKVMVDGVPVSFRPDLEAFLGPEFIPAEVIERIEVAKGPLSALYGANAFLATVNVITREPEEREMDFAQRLASVNGNFGFGASGVASYSGLDRSILLSATFDRIDRSGLRVRRTYEFQDIDSPVYDQASRDDQAKPTSVFGRFDYHHDGLGDFRLEVGLQERDAKGEFLLNSLLTHRSRISLFNRWAALHWQKHIGDVGRIQAYVSGSYGDVNPGYQLFLTNNFSTGYKPNYGYKAVNALVEVGYEVAWWLHADVGVDAELRKEDALFYTQVSYETEGGRQPFDEIDLIEPSAKRSHQLYQVGPYLQLHSTPLKFDRNLRLTAAARGDWIEFGPVSYPFQQSFRGAVAYRFSPLLTAKLIAGRAFQAPSGTLLFAHGGFGNTQNVVGSIHLDDPRPLRPQIVTSIELVTASQIGNFLSVELSAFYQDLNDVIRFNQVGSIVVAKNGGREVIAGGELVANLHLWALRLYAALSLSRQLSIELTPDLAGIASFNGSPSLYPRMFGYVGCHLDVIPSRLFFNAEFHLAGPRGASQVNFYHNDSRPYDVPAYHELDLTISTEDLPLIDPDLHTRLLFSMRNALDANYVEPGFSGVDIPQPRRTLFLQIRQTM